MIPDLNERIAFLKHEVSWRRAEWQSIRQKMRKRKNDLFALQMDIAAVRRDREYRMLRKQKKRLSKEIRHLEQKINRAIARLAKEKSEGQ